MHKMEFVQFCTTVRIRKNEPEEKVDRSAKIPSGQSIQPTWKLADALLPSVSRKKNMTKDFFVPFNPRLEV